MAKEPPALDALLARVNAASKPVALRPIGNGDRMEATGWAAGPWASQSDAWTASLR
jgi:hypothetical protein